MGGAGQGQAPPRAEGSRAGGATWRCCGPSELARRRPRFPPEREGGGRRPEEGGSRRPPVAAAGALGAGGGARAASPLTAPVRPAGGGGGGQDEPAAAAPGRHRHRQGAERPAGLQRDVLAPREQREGPAHHAGEQPVRRGREQLYPSVLEDIEELHETE